MHPCGLHLHSVHDVIDLVPDDSQDDETRIRQSRLQGLGRQALRGS